MRTIHLFPTENGLTDDWTSTDRDIGSFSMWAASAVATYPCSLHFHATEADARAASELSDDVAKLKEGVLVRMAELSTARENEASAQSDLRACQRENERLEAKCASMEDMANARAAQLREVRQQFADAQTENERLTVELGRLTRLVEDLHKLTKL